jgi:CheY-like chemotaxis protein
MPEKKRILSISYDKGLLVSRELLLERAGFEVTSALGKKEAMEWCSQDPVFHLIVMGHSIPQPDKSELLSALRPNCKAPLLSIRRPGENPLPQADFSVDSAEGPAALIQAVKNALG